MEPKPKLLYIITQGTWGGAQRYVFDLAIALKKTHDVTVAIGEQHGAQDLLQALSGQMIPTVQLKHLVRAISPLHDILAIHELKQLIQKETPDIIHLNSSKAGIIGSLAIACLKKTARPHVVYTAHGWVFDEPLHPSIRFAYRSLEAWTARWKDRIITLGTHDHIIAEQRLNIPTTSLITIPLGTNITRSPWTKQQARDILSQEINIPIGQHDRIIGCIANLYKTKGIDILLDALAQQQSTRSNTHCIIIGDGPERTTLEAKKQLHGLTQVHFLGFKKHATHYLPAFDLFVLPSLKEGLPYTLLEAMDNRLPIVATRVGNIPDLLADEMLVAPGDSKSLGHALVSITTHPQSPQYRNHNSLEGMVQTTSSLYQSLLSKTQ